MNSPQTVIELHTEADTVALGARLAEALPPGAVVSLVGPLGAGKTRLVQGVAAALGVTEEVTSPTFVLLNEYTTGRLPIYHFDAYRLKDEDEFLELGPDEYFSGQAPAGPGITFVEWGDLVGRCLPENSISVSIEPLGATRRRAVLDGVAV